MTDRAAFKDAVREALIDRAEALFVLAWGEPARQGGREWRARANDALSMQMQGADRGKWFDHKAGVGGDVFHFYGVNVLGLEKGQDFARVLNEAANWCGILRDQPVDLTALHRTQKARAEKAAEEEKRDSRQRAQLVADLMAQAKPIKGTPAAAYLAARGITELPADGLAYLDPVGSGASIMHPRFAACVIWAKDEQGKIVGGQRIVLNKDGTRADVDGPKPFFAAAAGCPARFAARIPDSPLCIAEGPESALSVWLATGFETWAVFGVSNWQTAPIPTGRKVILCPDRDLPEGTHPPESDEAKAKEAAARAFNKAVAQHASRNCDLWIATAPEPVGSKRDLNDTLQRAGVQAVRDAINAATHHCTPDSSPSWGRVILPPPADLPSGRFTDMQAELETATPESALPVAVAVAYKMQASAPYRYGPQSILDMITGFLAHPISADEIAAIADRIEWRQRSRKEVALARSDIDLKLRQRHNVQTVTDLSEVQIEGLQGVLAVKAPKGAGKTQRIGRPFTEWALKQGGGMMAMAHRVTLIAELSARLGLPNYKTDPTTLKAEAERVGGIAVCSPSTARGDITELFPAPRFVFVDEIAQVLQFAADAMCSAGATDASGVYDRLLQIVGDAQAVVVADAGLDSRTIRFLEKARPGERFTIVEMEATDTGKTAKVYASDGPAMEETALALAAGGKVWFACEGSESAARKARYFKELGYKVLCVTAATKKDPEQAAFLSDADGQSLLYDLVIASPAISSGLSIEHRNGPHFTLGVYSGAGHATCPEDATQQIARVRYLKRFIVELPHSNIVGGQTVEATRSGIERAAVIEGADAEWTDYDDYAAGVEASANNAKADFRAALWWLLEADGWTLERADDPAIEALGRKAAKHAKDQHTTASLEAILSAPVVDTHQAGLLDGMERDTNQEARLQAHKIRIALGKLELTAADVAFWDGGRGAKCIERFGDLIGAPIKNTLGLGPLVHRDFAEARRKLFGVLFDGIDWRKPIAPDAVELILDRVMAQPETYVAAGIVGPKFRAKQGKSKTVQRPKQAGRELADILNRCGLQVVSKRVRFVPKLPSLVYTKSAFGTKHPLEKLRGYEITVLPESLEHMAGIMARRGVFDIDAALMQADRTYSEPRPLMGWPQRLAIAAQRAEPVNSGAPPDLSRATMQAGAGP